VGCCLGKVELWLGTFYDGAMESAELMDGTKMGTRYCYEGPKDPPLEGGGGMGGYVLTLDMDGDPPP
jgi:hypothetical protein